MKVLFLCNTYMQVINAIQIKLKMKKDCDVDIVISDHSVGAEEVVKSLKKANVFSNVNFAKTKYYTYQQNIISDLLDVFRGVGVFNDKYTRFLSSKNSTYDEIFYFNIDMMLYTAIDTSIKNGKTPKCIQFEEGIHSYSTMKNKDIASGRYKIIKKLRALFKRYDIYQESREYYCYYPEFLLEEDKRKGHKIPPLKRDDKELVATLNKVFSYEPGKEDFHWKYIFFGSSADVDGHYVKEDEIILKIAKRVGIENLLVKTHPRDNRTIYKENGLMVMENSSVPWEVIQLNHDFSSHVFITLSSGSVLTGSAILDETIDTYYLYPVVKEKNIDFYHTNEENLKKTIVKLKVLGKCMSHHIYE